MKDKGKTLIEMLIVIGIIGIIGAIAYPILFINSKMVTEEMDKSLERNEVRAIANFLKEDIRYSTDIVREDIGEPLEFRSTVKQIDKSIVYTRVEGESGSYHVVRRFEGRDIHFPEVENAEIYDISEDLAQVKLYMKENVSEDRRYELKIARWRWQVMAEEEEQTIYDLIEEENLFVIGAGFAMGGTSVTGDGATVFFQADLTQSDFNGNAQIAVSNLYIDGSVSLGGSQGMGSPTEPGVLTINGDVTLSGNSSFYGDVYVNGTLTLSGSGKIFGNVYVQENFNFNNGRVEGDVYVNQNLYIKDGTLDGDMYVNGNVTINWTPSFTTGSMVYYYGTITHPASYNPSHFAKIATTIVVPEKEIPEIGIPAPKPDQWYFDNGYVLNGGLSNDAKVVVLSGNYTQTLAANVSRVIVANLNGDIKITSGSLNLTGVIYAPRGSVEIGTAGFSGLIIASGKVNMSKAGMTITFEPIENYIPNTSQYPFLSTFLP